MQFRLRTLLAVVTLAAVVCGTFAAPPIVALPVLALILWISPALWLGGAVYSRGCRQAFFLGGALAGAVPYLTAAILSVVWYAEWIDDGDWPYRLDGYNAPWHTFRAAIAVWLPGACSVVGGTLGMLAHRLAIRAATEKKP